jgi:DNA-directed RNA polymerase specialized sigma24 family protein
MSHVAIEPVASEGDRLVMRELLKQKSLNARQHQRLQIVVARLEGRRPSEIADMLGLRAAVTTARLLTQSAAQKLTHPGGG